MEIQVGEYVRTKDGHIGRYIQDAPVNNKVLEIDDNEIIFATEKNNIVKHSFNLINLIQIGDYVNGKEIILKDENENCVMYGFKYKDKQMIWYIYEEDIHSIVTKEQFASVEYKVGGENERN